MPEEVNVEGNALPKAPENKVTIAASYYLDTDVGTFTLSANWNHISEQYTTFFERELYNVGSFSTAGARIIFDSMDESLRMILSIFNITDEDAPIRRRANKQSRVRRNLQQLCEDRNAWAVQDS